MNLHSWLVLKFQAQTIPAHLLGTLMRLRQPGLTGKYVWNHHLSPRKCESLEERVALHLYASHTMNEQGGFTIRTRSGEQMYVPGEQ